MASQTRQDLTTLRRELKAPSLLASADRIAKRARDVTWSHEEFLAAARPASRQRAFADEKRSMTSISHISDWSYLGALDFVEA